MDIGTSVVPSSGSWHLSDMTSSFIRRMSGTVSMLQPWVGCIPSNSLLFLPEDEMMVDDTPTIHAGSTMMSIPPINQLPVEILTEIFSCYLKGGEEVNMHPNAPSCLSFSSKSQSNPMELERVCRHWRGVLLSSPTLWSSMCIFAPSFDDIKRISRWLQHAGGCPLSLELRQSDEPNDSEQLATDRIMELLFSRFSQWKSIEFHIDKFARVPALSHLPSSPPVWLEHALLNISPRSYSNWLERLWNIVHASPALRSIHWRRFQDPASSIFAVDHPSFLGNVQVRCQINPRIPLSQLIDLQVSSEVTFTGALEVLRSCQNLERLNIPVDMSQALPALDTLVVSNLRDLHVMVAGDIAPLLDHINLPALEKLFISQRFAERISLIGPSFHRFIARSSCPLRTLRFLDYPGSEDDVLEMLKAPLHSLVNLDLICKLGEPVINLLCCTAIDGKVQCLLPRLENLEIFEVKTSDEIVAKMILSRIYYYRYTETCQPQISLLKSAKLSRFLYTLYDSPIFQIARENTTGWRNIDDLVPMVARLYRETREEKKKLDFMI